MQLVSNAILGDERLEREWRAAKRIRRSATDDPTSPAITGTIAPVVPTAQEVNAVAWRSVFDQPRRRRAEKPHCVFG
jgi:hypothetical protein